MDEQLLRQALEAMEGFRALVKGEAPSLLDYDGGLDAERFDAAIASIRTALSTPAANPRTAALDGYAAGYEAAQKHAAAADALAKKESPDA